MWDAGFGMRDVGCEVTADDGRWTVDDGDGGRVGNDLYPAEARRRRERHKERQSSVIKMFPAARKCTDNAK